jgi:isopenicillin-N epimerase
MWALSPGVHHLNHGSFGAVPTEVRARQRDWQRRWDANPTGFVFTDLVEGMNEARVALAAFLGADPAGLAPVVNASSGVAAVIRSIEPWLVPGDEIVTTSQDYNAVRQTLEFSAGRHGARVRVVEIPFPIDSPSTVRDLILDSVTDRVRVVVVDHVTSPTGLVFPVEEIVAALEPDVPVLVDGAHGPGQVELDLGSLGASW